MMLVTLQASAMLIHSSGVFAQSIVCTHTTATVIAKPNLINLIAATGTK